VMWENVINVVRMYLPPRAKILFSEEPDRQACVCTADVDGDGVPEIAGAYRWQGETYLLLLKQASYGWRVLANIKETRKRVSYFGAAPVTSASRSSLMIGWHSGDELSQLSFYEWTGKGFMDVVAARAVRLYSASNKTKDGVKWGYIDDQGQFILFPQYDYAEDFQENGLAVVQVKNRSGLINRSGQFVVAPKYSTITQFSEGRAEVIDDQGFWVIDEKGRIITRKPHDFIGMYQEGRALFAGTDAAGKYLYGYLDREGKEVIPLQFQTGTNFTDGKAVAQIKESEYVLIGPNGERLQTYPYAFVGPLGDGLLAFKRNTHDPFGYMDEKGKVVIQPQFTGAQPFVSGRAVVNTSKDVPTNQYGLINKAGTFIIKPEYNDIELLGEGRVAVGKAKDKQKPYIGSKYAIADTDGRFLTDFIYNFVTKYKNGVASAYDDQSTFFIDRSGQVVKHLPIIPGSGWLSMEDNVIKAVVDQRTSYYDRTGRLIWKPNTIIPLTDRYRVIEEKYAPHKDYYVYYPRIEGMENMTAQERVNQRLKELSQVKPIDRDAQLDYSYSGDFSVGFFKKHLLVLELEGYSYPFGAAHGMPSKVYVHIDLTNGNMYELKDLFKPGSNYVQVLGDIIGNQIKTNPEYSYVFPGSYKGIQANQPFYVKEDALYLYFNPYDIAPYAAGFPTFKIPFADIMSIIDVNGSFWRAFH
jgi:hypothetical protein